MRDDFAIFILSHGNPNGVLTLNALKKTNYTGKYYFILDNEDQTIEQYKQLYGREHVVVFDRVTHIKNHLTDVCDNFNTNHNSIVFARNECFNIANQLGIRYFYEFEDDYRSLTYRYEGALNNRNVPKLSRCEIYSIEEIIEAQIQFLNSDPRLMTVAWMQAGDFLGGSEGSHWRKGVLRKAMNSFLCDTTKPFQFLGRMNDDVNAYVSLGKTGSIFLSIRNCSIEQTETQQNKSGHTKMYREFGTYLKSFYSVMINPSCVRIRHVDNNHPRVHHNVVWENAVPCIVDQRYKK